ncbi:hypothetical protein KPL52_09330 [Clostridium tagluense]|nr:hypothetical protein [Clostridium tagluense]
MKFNYCPICAKELGEKIIGDEGLVRYCLAGFISFVKAKPFVDSNEVDDIMWCEIEEVNRYIARVDNMSGIHFDNSMRLLNL